ncbi:hypothetical protein K491DRAFT_684233 [Lophiostoma macrostomum CBS 122681]|uniref:Uncharacterized protein n=1 Tax=Lophiostoma macrostomum CBS 122681 TaxID=1314788 RepID=A0A6A6SPT2_9PLEO|nr:hypothetical protein K491DRAFT_684233 [Lophiostoma macrostomum CBS 122681]
MAGKGPPKLSEEGPEALHQNFRRNRTAVLRKWYSEATNTWPKFESEWAQVRLILLLETREVRLEIRRTIDERNRCRQAGDTKGMDAATKKLESKYYLPRAQHLRDQAAGNIHEKMEAKCIRKWRTKRPSLAELLNDGEVDTPHDFPDVPDIVLKHEKPSEEDGPGGESLKKESPSEDNIPEVDIGDTLTYTGRTVDEKHQPTAYVSSSGVGSTTEGPVDITRIRFDTHRASCDHIWNRHEALLRAHYQKSGLKEHVIDIRLAVQHQMFNRHINAEALVTYQEQCSEAETCCFEDGLWNLCAVSLWAQFEGAQSWDSPSWTPGGHLQIRTLYDLG